MIVGLGMACQRLKSALGKDTCSDLTAFVGTSSLLGRKRSDSHLGDGYVWIYAGGLYTPILRRAW